MGPGLECFGMSAWDCALWFAWLMAWMDGWMMWLWMWLNATCGVFFCTVLYLPRTCQSVSLSAWLLYTFVVWLLVVWWLNAWLLVWLVCGFAGYEWLVVTYVCLVRAGAKGTEALHRVLAPFSAHTPHSPMLSPAPKSHAPILQPTEA